MDVFDNELMKQEFISWVEMDDYKLVKSQDFGIIRSAAFFVKDFIEDMVFMWNPVCPLKRVEELKKVLALVGNFVKVGNENGND